MFFLITQKENGHETDLEMSPRPLGTMGFEEIYIRTLGKQSDRSEINLRLVYSHFYDHVDHHIFQLITAFHLFQQDPVVNLLLALQRRPRTAIGTAQALQSRGLSVRVVPGAELPEFAQEYTIFNSEY